MFLAYRFFFLHHDFRTLMGKIQKNTSKVRKFRLSRKFCLLPRNTELNIRPKKVNDKSFIFRLFQFLNFQVYFNHKNPSNSIFVERCVLCISFSFSIPVSFSLSFYLSLSLSFFISVILCFYTS